MNMNPYYNPETLGLTIIGTLDQPNLCYEFNMFVVWQEIATNKLYYAQSSGCSCPTPFEEFPTVESLTPVNNDTWDNFESEIQHFPADEADKVEVCSKVARLLRENNEAW